jgi:hypothetical protein
MKKILYFSIFFLIFSFVFASNETALSPEIEKILREILNLLQKNTITSSVVVPKEIFEKREPVYPNNVTEPVRSEVKFPSMPKPFEQKTLDVKLPQASEVKDLALPVLPKNVKPAIPSTQPVTPEVIKPILPDEDRGDDVIVQINNLKITRIVTSSPEAKAIFFAVRDLGWRCLFYESEESNVSMPCALDLRKPILQRELVIKVVDDTILLLRNRKRANIEDFQVGDKINVYGFMDKDNYGIEALIVRNLSKSSSISKPPTTRKFTGYITSKEQEKCPPCVYQIPACLMPCKTETAYYLTIKETYPRTVREYLLEPQNDQAREAIQKYANTNTLVTVEGTLKVNTILVEKVYLARSTCIQVITPAKNPLTGECREFPTPCNVPPGWQKVDRCP